jgi:hypothetical protein
MSAWYPSRFLEPASPGRLREVFGWFRDTLSPLDGLPEDLEYAWVEAVIELDESHGFFASRVVPASAAAARALNVRTGQEIMYFPRRGFDLWGVRYFILPVRTHGWRTEDRGFAAFLPHAEVIYPPRSAMASRDQLARWTDQADWQLLHNQDAYPRAWLVHAARIVPPATTPEARAALLDEILYQDDLFWSEPGRPVYDPRFLAWVETEDAESLRNYLPDAAVEAGETVAVVRAEPQRVELRARLRRPGLVILADTLYPGWRLTIDGRPAPILRANRMMRGAAVEAGEHTLVYVYDPLSFKVGVALTLAGIAALALVGLRRRGTQ